MTTATESFVPTAWADPAELALRGFPIGIATQAVHEATWLLWQLSGRMLHGAGPRHDVFQVSWPKVMYRAVLGDGPVDTVSQVYTEDPWDGTIVELEHAVLPGRSVQFKLGTASPGQAGHVFVHIVYDVLSNLPPNTERIVLKLAQEYANAALGNKCNLPERITSITRQGASWTLLDPADFLDRGMTGVVQVDQWLAATNPAKLKAKSVLVDSLAPRLVERRTVLPNEFSDPAFGDAFDTDLPDDPDEPGTRTGTRHEWFFHDVAARRTEPIFIVPDRKNTGTTTSALHGLSSANVRRAPVAVYAGRLKGGQARFRDSEILSFTTTFELAAPYTLFFLTRVPEVELAGALTVLQSLTSVTGSNFSHVTIDPDAGVTAHFADSDDVTVADSIGGLSTAVGEVLAIVLTVASDGTRKLTVNGFSEQLVAASGIGGQIAATDDAIIAPTNVSGGDVDVDVFYLALDAGVVSDALARDWTRWALAMTTD